MIFVDRPWGRLPPGGTPPREELNARFAWLASSPDINLVRDNTTQAIGSAAVAPRGVIRNLPAATQSFHADLSFTRYTCLIVTLPTPSVSVANAIIRTTTGGFRINFTTTVGSVNPCQATNNLVANGSGIVAPNSVNGHEFVYIVTYDGVTMREYGRSFGQGEIYSSSTTMGYSASSGTVDIANGSAQVPLQAAIILPYEMGADQCVQALYRPYSLFEPRRIWVPVSAGGGAYSLTAEQGSYTLTGQAAGLLAGRVLAAAQGSYTLSGQDVALLKGNTLTADQGSYALTGQDVGLLRGLLLSAAQGSYALTGQDATLTYTPLGAFSLTADQGSYALTGQSVFLLWGRVLAAGQGSYTLNGQDATLTYTPIGAYILTAGQGSYALTGQDVLLQWGHVLAAAQGSYTLTGQAATLSRGLVMAAAQGSYTLTGQAAAFARTYVLSAGYGSYALTGQIVSLTYSGAALEALEYLLLISHITQSMSKTSKVTMEVDLISRIQQQLDGSSSI